MCMLLGFSGRSRYELKNPISNFFNLSTKHPDGWGLALYDKSDNTPCIIKQPVPAYRSEYAKSLCKQGISARLAIGHIRFKTYGNISYANTHPFIQRIKGEDWVFAHNGSIDFSFIKKYLERKPLGETDSEKVSCFIADRLDKLANEAEMEEKAECIENVVYKLSEYGKLNLLISDGQYLYVHTNCADTLYFFRAKNAVLFCTKPVMQGNWESVPLNTLLVYKNGEKVYEGEPHDALYTPKKNKEVINLRGGSYESDL